MIEINSILEKDNGMAKEFNEDEWRNYMGVFGTYELPFETIEKLTEIANEVEKDINDIEDSLSISNTSISISGDKEDLKKNNF